MAARSATRSFRGSLRAGLGWVRASSMGRRYPGGKAPARRLGVALVVCAAVLTWRELGRGPVAAGSAIVGATLRPHGRSAPVHHDRILRSPPLIPPSPISSPIIFMRPHMFGARGDHQDRTFVPLVIRAVLHFNPTAHVYMLHNDPAFGLPGEERFHGLLVEDFETPAVREFKAIYVHLSTNATPFEMASTLAYFYASSLMDALKLDRVVVVETDVLVFCDLWETLGAHWNLDAVDAILMKRRIMGASFVTRTYLETFVNVALDFYRDDAGILTQLRQTASTSGLARGGVSDMTVNAWLAKPVYGRQNRANRTVVLAELSRLFEIKEGGAVEPGSQKPPSEVEGATKAGAPSLAFFDSNLRTANYSFGGFEMEPSAFGPVKKLHAQPEASAGGPPHGMLLSKQLIALWSLHFQGGTKELIPRVFDLFIGQPLLSSRLDYYVRGHADPAARTAAAGPARDAASLGIAAAAPVTGRGTANPDGLRAKGRLLMLNASICAAGPATLTLEIERQIGPNSPVARQGALSAYVADACAVAPPTTAAYVVGDVGSCFSRPVFAKARPCGCTTTALLNMNRAHHFGFDATTLDTADPPWADKLPIAFWRGSATGTINDRLQGARYHLLSRWARSTSRTVDVGMTSLPMSTGNATRDAELQAYTKPAASLPSMLRHRYLISAEGYDVATNLKWALWSRSAVIMPRPTLCSWLMEDRLVPWVHYVPVAADFSNLTDAVDWCEDASNAGACERIGAAGRAYLQEHGFMDAVADLEVGKRVAEKAARQGLLQ